MYVRTSLTRINFVINMNAIFKIESVDKFIMYIHVGVTELVCKFRRCTCLQDLDMFHVPNYFKVCMHVQTKAL